jgi:phytoene dehydrogenase-like protein
MQNFADLFVNLIEENGGKVSLGKKVDQIVIRDGKAAGVRLEDGEEIHSEFVVSNTDWKQTFTKLIASQYLNEEFIRKIEGAKVSESFLCVYLGTELDKSSFGDLAFHTSYFPSYDKPFLEKDPNDPDFFKYCDVGITISSLIDESSAPKGKSVIRLVAPAPYDYLGKWQTDNGKRTDKYRELKERVSNQLVATTEGVIPYLSGHIVVKEIATPLTYERYTLNSEGASAGWSWDPKHALAKEFTSSLDSVRTPIENLFTVGHWSYPPGGLPSAMLTGKGVSNIIS